MDSHLVKSISRHYPQYDDSEWILTFTDNSILTISDKGRSAIGLKTGFDADKRWYIQVYYCLKRGLYRFLYANNTFLYDIPRIAKVPSDNEK